ncbi:hypothetical protein DFP72DRAFT_875966 [Ephemerocybe angulata]|uniref:NmrA-like domain-containing protein n=1 Tax=Ephemerocybe angulata TaxID=980116 RepID=A0A8H6IBF5_9AGAR|nr:hypothetical protein DFP72DRAFT_875966 [Tulosesus angulatus]
MSTTTKIFLTGATGYIGGSILTRLLAHPDRPSFELTALVRNPDAAKKLAALGVKTISGSYDDLALLTDAAAQADVVFTMVCVTVWDQLPPAQAILAGLKQRFEQTSKPPILIHTSGAGIVMDITAHGHSGAQDTYSDLDAETLASRPGKALPMAVESALVRADEEGYVRSYLITPGTIFGLAKGPLVDLGVQHKHSLQLPLFFRTFIKRGRAATIGPGLNVWPAVSYNDNADLYLRLFDAARSSSSSVGHGREGFYFAESCEYSALEIAQASGRVLHKLGVAEVREPDEFSEEQVQASFGAFWEILSSTSRARGERARAQLGWSPKEGKAELLASVEREIEELLKDSKL